MADQNGNNGSNGSNGAGSANAGGSDRIGSKSPIGGPAAGPVGPNPSFNGQGGTLTTNQGRPVGDNQNSMTAGRRGPIVLDDFLLLEKMTQFNRERVPERVVHAKGSGAHGEFVVTNDITKYTTARIFSQVGNKCPVFARFSTVGGEHGSADTARDPRGFAVKFYTEEGNWDMVGNNTPTFFIRDPIKFGDFIHTQKRDPHTNLHSPTMMWDFWSLSPESLHQVTILFSDRGIPDGYRFMHGYSSHTFSLTNEAGELFYCKWHFKSAQGIKNLLPERAEEIAGQDGDYAQRDLVHAIQAGEFPSWNVKVQIMPESEIDKFRWNPFDLTKVWPHAEYPLIDVGVMTLNRNPRNYFAEVEQAAFNPSNVVPGMGYSPDKMLQGRLLSYPDAHRYRIGTNYDALPINRPQCPFATYNRDGAMRFDENGGDGPNYEPNSFGGPKENPKFLERPYHTTATTEQVARYDHREGNDDYTQAGNLWRLFSEDEKNRTAKNIAGSLGQTPERIQKLQLTHFEKCDPDYAARIANFLKDSQHPEYINPADAAELDPTARLVEK